MRKHRKIGRDGIDQISAQNIGYYDAEAGEYDSKRYSTVRGRALDALQKRILVDYLADLSPSADILEIGCGTGRFVSSLSKRGYRLTGIDVSEGMLREARQRLAAEGDGTTKVIGGH